MKYIIRILLTPSLILVLIIGAIILNIKYLINHIKYGGEFIVYSRKCQTKTIFDVFKKVDNFTEDYKYQYNEEIICPYCDFKYKTDVKKSGEQKCFSCGQFFYLDVNSVTLYQTKKLEI